jgi:tetratricopeptide (TPR) repeat protein
VRGSVRWAVAVSILTASFFVVWAISGLLFGLSLDIALSLAGLATAVLSLPLGAWATADARQIKPEPHGSSEEGKSAQVVVGEIPREPRAFQPRPDLSEQLAAAGNIAVVQALTGARGVGKTQLAAAYARAKIAEGWPVVGWIVAEEQSQVLAGLERLSGALGLASAGDDSETAAARVRSWLETKATSSCLLVFDNAVDPGVIRRWLPSGGGARIIITSTNVAFEDVGTVVVVGVFSTPEALDFLEQRTGLEDQDGAREVAAELGFLPLALGQAAATMRSQRLTYRVFLDRLRSLPVDRYLVRRSRDSYPRGAAQAVLLSLAPVEQAVAFARDIVGLVAVLSPAGIQRDILLKAGELNAAGTVTAAEIDESIGLLAEASLITFSIDGQSVIMHRFTRRVAQDREREQRSLTSNILLASRVLTEMRVQRESKWSERNRGRHMIQQIDALWEVASSEAEPGSAEAPEFIVAVLSLRSWAVGYLWDINDSAQAISMGRTVVSDHERYLGKDSRETVLSRSGLALGYGGIGRHDEAIETHKEIIDWFKGKSTEADSAITLNFLNTFGNNFLESAEDYREPGRLIKGLEIHEKNYADCRRVCGEDAFLTLMSGCNLARSFMKVGRLGEALTLQESVWEISKRAPQIPVDFQIGAQGHLAEIYWELGRSDEAFQLLDAASLQAVGLYGADSPTSLHLRMTLAGLRKKSGDFEVAAEMYERIAVDSYKTLGYSHAVVFRALEGFAASREQSGRIADAIEAYGQMHAACLRLVGPASPITHRAEQELERLRRETAHGENRASHPDHPNFPRR